MRDMVPFLSLEHLEAIVGLLISLLSVLWSLREKRGPGEGERQERRAAVW